MAEFSLSRSIDVNAPADRVRGLVNDLREWEQWSPWNDLDPDMEHVYTGPDSGVGASHMWKGNAKAGQGRMTITESTAERVVCDLEFIKPFKAENTSRLDFVQAGGGLTRVTWTMTGRQNPVLRMLGRLYFDKQIAKDFDRGLARLKQAAEARSTA